MDSGNGAALRGAGNPYSEENEADEDVDQGRFLQEPFVYSDCDGYYNNHLVIVLFLVAITFLIFTSCMFAEQVEAIETNQGKIARMKMKVGRGGTELTRVTEEFNEMFGGNSPNVSWHWFIPLRVQFPGSMEKVVLGYEWDKSFDSGPYMQDEDEEGSSSVENLEAQQISTDAGGTNTFPDVPNVESSVDMEDITLDESSVNSGQSGGMKKRTKSRDDVPELT